MKRTDVLQRLKTRELIYQDISGNYPVQGAVGYFVDASGTFGTSTVSIDGSGNMIVPGDLDVSGTATLGDLRTRATKVHIGLGAGATGQSDKTVAIGRFAGNTGQGSSSVAIGDFAGSTNQAISAIAIGTSAGITNQGSYSVAIGYGAGNQNQGTNSIAIGFQAATANQGDSSIVLNASGAPLAGATGGFFVKPVATRASTTGASALYIDNVTGEIFRSP